LSSIISYGTDGYPEPVARRLRVFDATAWAGSLMVFSFALSDRFSEALASINAVVASALAAIPLLHRFGELAATRRPHPRDAGDLPSPNFRMKAVRAALALRNP